MNITLREAETPADITACWPVMAQLRPHITTADELVTRVMRQNQAGYRLLAAWRGNTVIGLAGYRVQENLIRGRFLYVDDLVTEATERRSGLGARLLAAMRERATAMDCPTLVLDTALDNVLGHRFYYRNGMLAAATRFAQPLT